jgi:hypothetical protein
MLAFNLRDIVASMEDTARKIHRFGTSGKALISGKPVPQSNQEVPTCLVVSLCVPYDRVLIHFSKSIDASTVLSFN